MGDSECWDGEQRQPQSEVRAEENGQLHDRSKGRQDVASSMAGVKMGLTGVNG